MKYNQVDSTSQVTELRITYTDFVGKSGRKKPLSDLGADRRIILKPVLKN